MPKANEIKKGQVIDFQGKILAVSLIDVQSPSARGAATLYKMRMKDIKTGQKVENTFTGDDMVTLADFQRRTLQFLFQDGEHYTFMDTEDYSQYMMDEDQLGESGEWLFDGLEGIMGMIVEDQLAAIELPQALVLTVSETNPAMKAASASARTKPATLNNGVVVQVPEYIVEGEEIKVNVETKKFMSRA